MLQEETQECRENNCERKPRNQYGRKRKSQRIFSRQNNRKTTESQPIVNSATSRIGLMVTDIKAFVATMLWFALLTGIGWTWIIIVMSLGQKLFWIS